MGNEWGYGPGTALFRWATEEEGPWFDGWCASRGIDPWDLPLHRMINLIWFAYIDGVGHEEAEEIRKRLFETTASPVKPVYRPVTPQKLQTMPETKEAPVKKTLGTRTDYVPPWYDERKAYMNAKQVQAGISSLPKMKPVK